MKLILNILILTVFLVCSANSLIAQGETDTIPTETVRRKLRLGPFFWFVNLKGTLYKPPAPSTLPEPPPPKFDIDLSFKDISSNLKFALMFYSEYRAQKTTFRTSLSTIMLEGQALTPGDLILQDVKYKFTYFAGEVSAGRTILKKDKLRLDALAGFKWVHFAIAGSTKAGGNIPFEGNRAKWWFDPMIGTDILYEPFKRLEVHFYGDVGGFLESRVTYQFLGEIDYYFNPWLYLSLGYRHWHLKVTPEDAIFNGQITGATIRLGFLL